MVQQERTRKKKHLMSCDPCRYRRIKCVRDSIDEVCEECNYRKFTCTSEHIKARRPAPQRPPPRDGRRLLTIKSVDSSPSPDGSFSSLESKLAFTSLERQLGKHFFEAYLSFNHMQIPTGSWTFYYLKMLESDCNLDRMKPEIALVCLCAMAIGSRWSGSESFYDDPVFQLPSSSSDSLSNQRDMFFKNVSNRAFIFADAMGVHRTPSTHALRASLLLFDLRSYVSDNTQQSVHKRTLLNLQFALVPALLRLFISGIPLSILAQDEDETMAGVDLGLMWTISFFLDSDLAVNTGYPLSLMEKDIERSRNGVQNMMIPKIREAIQSSESWFVAEVALHGICLNMAFINRFVAQNLMAGELTKQPSDIAGDKVARFIRWLDDILDILDLFFERSKQLFSSRTIIPFHWVYTFRFAAMKTAWNVYESVCFCPIIASSNYTINGINPSSASSSVTSQTIKTELGMRVISLVRTFCKMLHMAQGRFPLGVSYSMDKVMSLFDYYICNEDIHRSPDYSHEEKMANLDTIQRAFQINSWAWPNAVELANILQESRTKHNLVSTTVFQHYIGQYTSVEYGKVDLWSISSLAYENNSDHLCYPSHQNVSTSAQLPDLAIASITNNKDKGVTHRFSSAGSEIEDEQQKSQHERHQKLQQVQELQELQNKQQIIQQQEQQQKYIQQNDTHSVSNTQSEYQGPPQLSITTDLHPHVTNTVGIDNHSTPSSISAITCPTPPTLYHGLTPISPMAGMVPVLIPAVDGYGNITSSTNVELWKYINEL